MFDTSEVRSPITIKHVDCIEVRIANNGVVSHLL